MPIKRRWHAVFFLPPQCCERSKARKLSLSPKTAVVNGHSAHLLFSEALHNNATDLLLAFHGFLSLPFTNSPLFPSVHNCQMRVTLCTSDKVGSTKAYATINLLVWIVMFTTISRTVRSKIRRLYSAAASSILFKMMGQRNHKWDFVTNLTLALPEHSWFLQWLEEALALTAPWNKLGSIWRQLGPAHTPASQGANTLVHVHLPVELPL